MSRIGQQPIPIPAGIEVKLQPGLARVKGPKGQVEHAIPPEISVEQAGKELLVKRSGDEKHHKALHGLVRALLANAVKGCQVGYSRGLEIVGVGYRAQLQGRTLSLQVGFAHPVLKEIPQGVEVELPSPTKIAIRGASKQAVGQFAAELRRVRPPEPYKGKGIRYDGEYVKIKPGKKFAGGE